MTDTTPLGLIVVRLKVPVKNYPVGTELGYKDVADAIAALGSAYFFEVVRDQQGNPIPPLTPEEIEEAQRAAQRRAKSRRLILGADFDPLWDRVEGIPSAEELEQMRDDVDAVADVPPRVEAVETAVGRVDPGAPGATGHIVTRSPSGPAWMRDAVDADWFSNPNDAVAAARRANGNGGVVRFTSETYTFTEPILLYPGLTLMAENERSTTLRFLAGSAGLKKHDPAANVPGVVVANIDLWSDGTGTVGVDARGLGTATFQNVRVAGFTEAQVWWGGAGADGYTGGWSNTWNGGRVIASATGPGMRFSGRSSNNLIVANNISVRDTIITVLDNATSIGVDMQEGDTNLFEGCDVGYGAAGTSFLLGAGAYMNRFVSNRIEDTVNGVVIDGGSRNTFVASNLRTVSIAAGSPYNRFFSCDTTALNDADPRGNQTIKVGSGVNNLEAMTLRMPSGSNVLTTGRTTESYDRFHVGVDGQLKWTDWTTGSVATQLGLTSASRKTLAWTDGTNTLIPRHTFFPTAGANYRGSLIRLEGAAGSEDGVYICLKNADDSYSWRKVTLA